MRERVVVDIDAAVLRRCHSHAYMFESRFDADLVATNCGKYDHQADYAVASLVHPDRRGVYLVACNDKDDGFLGFL